MPKSSTADSKSTAPGTTATISPLTAAALLGWRCTGMPYRVPREESALLHQGNKPEHQSWGNGGYCGTLKPGREMPTLNPGLKVFSIQDDTTLYIRPSKVPFSAPIIREFKVQPSDESPLSKLFEVGEGMYTVTNERRPKHYADTRTYNDDGQVVTGYQREKVGMAESDAQGFLGPLASEFDWSMIDLKFWPHKTELNSSKQSWTSPFDTLSPHSVCV